MQNFKKIVLKFSIINRNNITFMNKKKILVTGCAGFIGSNLVDKLTNSKNNIVYGIDNLNNYYDHKLKKKRLKKLSKKKNFTLFKIDISSKKIY